MTSERIRWERNIILVIEMRRRYNILVENPKRKEKFKHLLLDGRIILMCIWRNKL
jgi:hypothetical protein